MSTIAMIGLGILVWVLLAIPVALFVAQMIKLGDRRSLDRTGDTRHGTSADGGAPLRTWHPAVRPDAE